VEVLIAGEKAWRWGSVFDREDILTTPLLPGLKIDLKSILRELPASTAAECKILYVNG